MTRALLVAGAVVLAAAALPAQTEHPKFELRPFAGASLPTGSQRDLFKDAALYGAQTAMELQPNFHLVGTFGWVPGTSTYAAPDRGVDIFSYDVGVEWGLVHALPNKWEFKPYLGFGAGARTYNFRASTLSSQTCTAGYGAVGAEFQLGRTALRAEGRDNLFCYHSPIAGVGSNTRNEVGVSLGLAYHFR